MIGKVPWRNVTGDVPRSVDLSGGDRRAAIVKGRSRMILGLLLSDNAEVFQSKISGARSANQLRASSVVFDEQRITAPISLASRLTSTSDGRSIEDAGKFDGTNKQIPR